MEETILRVHDYGFPWCQKLYDIPLRKVTITDTSYWRCTHTLYIHEHEYEEFMDRYKQATILNLNIKVQCICKDMRSECGKASEMTIYKTSIAIEDRLYDAVDLYCDDTKKPEKIRLIRE